MNLFDLSLFNFIHSFAGKWFLLDWFAIFFASYIGYAMLVFFAAVVINERNRKKRAYVAAWAILAAIISRGIITEAIRFFAMRQRPFVALGIDPVFTHAVIGSFPSGNATFFAVLVAPLWYLNRKWGMIYAGLVVIMGLARVYGAVHWPTDILGGLAIAAVVSYGVGKLVLGKTKEKNMHNIDIKNDEKNT